MSIFKKLGQQIHEALPASKRVYFVYTHKNGYNRFHNGLKANTEISYWCYTALRRAFPSVRFLRFQGEKNERIEKIRSSDVVIGHVGETLLKASKRTKKIVTFAPWAGHEDRSQVAFNCAPKEWEMSQYDMAASVIFLTSEHNVEEYISKPKNFWYPYLQELKKCKNLRTVHQPIDLTYFKRIKWEYSTNNFIYIGNTGHMKCLDDSKKLVAELGKKLTLYGCEGKNLNHLDMNQVNRLPFEADFFIQPGMWEAQCVSIFEAAARGFIPVVSKDTGYPYDHPFLLRYNDFSYNRKVLKELLNTTSSERKILADSLHARLCQDANHNNWQKLTDVLVEEVKALLCFEN